MLCREIMAACSEIHTKHINTVCGQKVELLNVKLAVHIVTTGEWNPRPSGLYRGASTHYNTPCHQIPNIPLITWIYP